MLAAATLRVHTSGRTDEFAADPPAWSQATAEVHNELQRRHGQDPRWQASEQQSDRMGQLLDAGEVIGTLLIVGPA